MSDDHVLVLVDGHCSLCKGWTHWAARRDAEDHLRFASQQGKTGKQYLEDAGIDSNQSVIVVADGRSYTRSRAVLEVVRVLSWPWPIVYAAILIPCFIRDWMYVVISSHRYQWFGRVENDFCEVNSDIDHMILD